MNKSMEQSTKRADFYIIHSQTFLKAPRGSSQQGCCIPDAVPRMPTELVPIIWIDVYFF